MSLVLDTSVLLATLNDSDPDHHACAALIRGADELLVIPSPALTELEYLLRTRSQLAAWLEFASDVVVGGYALHPVTPELLERTSAIQQRYADLDLGFVDAAVLVTCMELGEQKVATLDRRHFLVLRTDEGDSLEILPE